MKRWFKHKILPKLIACAAKGYITLLYWSCRIKIEGAEKYRERAKTEKMILALWHNRIGPVIPVLKRCAADFTYAAMISKSRDGEILSTLVESYPQARSIRVAHNNRFGALQKTIDHLSEKGDILLITPDGPTGPRYKIKPGIIRVAKAAGATVTPFSWAASRYWQLGNWDKMIIPKPFSAIYARFGSPIKFEKSEELPTEKELETIEEALLSASECTCKRASPDRDRWPK